MNISKNEQLVVDGNSFYEIDLQCVQKKQSQKHIRRNEHQEQSRQPQSADAPLQSRSNTMMIQQESLPYPQLLLQPHPLFPQRHIRQMIQRIQLQELSPKRLVPLPHPQLLLQPHPSLPHPQFVAAKSLMVKSSRFCSHFIL